MSKRILSASILIMVLVPLLIIGGNAFTVLSCFLALMSVYELLSIKDKKGKIPLIMKLLTYAAVAYMILHNMDNLDFNYQIDYKYVSLLIFIFVSPIVFFNNDERYSIGDSLYLIGITLFLGFSFNLIAVIRNYDLNYAIYLVLISTMTDTFALISGKLIGHTKLCPKISPKKTVEGMVVGTFMGTFVAASYYHVVMNHNYSIVLLIFLTCVLSLVGQLGDLVFSAIKRHYKTKDFSNLIPGHGGILDRFDSIIFIVLAFILIMSII